MIGLHFKRNILTEGTLMNQRTRSFISVFMAFLLVLSMTMLAGCTGSKDEQDNCYGEDMPVVNDD